VQRGGIALQESPHRRRGKCHVPGTGGLRRSKGVQLAILQDEMCIKLMRDFIAAEPELWNEDIGVHRLGPVCRGRTRFNR